MIGFADVSGVEACLRLLIAAACGVAIGWEREARARPAGLRTHVLVAVGACAFMLVGMGIAVEADSERMSLDPLRVLEGIIGGVGFLGTGAILQTRGQVKGLTTAAGLWVVAAIGVAAATAGWTVLVAALLLVLVTLTVLRQVERQAFAASGGDSASQDRRE